MQIFEPILVPGTVMLVQSRDWQLPWHWETRLPGDLGTVVASFADEIAAREYGRRNGWCG